MKISRIYDTDVACATPALMVDFNSILGLSDLNSSRSLGIFNYIGRSVSAFLIMLLGLHQFAVLQVNVVEQFFFCCALMYYRHPE